jgi:2-methylcitrate dehydratase PrpD
MSIALELARRINALRADRFPAEAIDWAKIAITDLIGCALAGAREDVVPIVVKAATTAVRDGGCTVIGSNERLRMLDAALVNGTAGHALDFDDTSKSLAGHPTVVIMPALLALAEQQKGSGEDVINAYIVGVEAATRIARGVNFHHYEKGWHPTATLGIFGAAVACGWLLRLDDQQMMSTLALCVSHASGVKSNFGSQTKPLHAGVAARSGLFAACLAQRGFTASADAFEHPQGFFEVFNGAGHYHPERMLKVWGAPLDLLAPGISIKKYPCVYSIHGAIDATIVLATEHRIGVDDVAKVTVMMHRRRLLPHVQRQATSGLDAKFSLPYVIARALVNGRVPMEHFEGENFRDPIVRHVMGLIKTKAHDDDANDYGATVEVWLKDGSVLNHSVPAPLGRGPEIPLPTSMLRDKFMDCATRVLPAEQGANVFEAFPHLEDAADVRDVTALLVPRAAGAADASPLASAR